MKMVNVNGLGIAGVDGIVEEVPMCDLPVFYSDGFTKEGICSNTVALRNMLAEKLAYYAKCFANFCKLSSDEVVNNISSRHKTLTHDDVRKHRNDISTYNGELEALIDLLSQESNLEAKTVNSEQSYWQMVQNNDFSSIEIEGEFVNAAILRYKNRKEEILIHTKPIPEL